jgi:hypothetical protein
MDRATLQPIGLLSLPEARPQFWTRRKDLIAISNRLSSQEREGLVRFLRGGTLVLAFMEQTNDIIDNSFSVPGGSGIRSDGTYYWRQDAANYVERYGPALPDEFLRHCEACNWQARELTSDETIAVDAVLAHQLGLKVRPPRLPSGPVAKPQSELLRGGPSFPRSEGIVPAPEPTHALASASTSRTRRSRTRSATCPWESDPDFSACQGVTGAPTHWAGPGAAGQGSAGQAPSRWPAAGSST